MEIIEESIGGTFSRIDPEEHRRWAQKEKARALRDKVMDIREAVGRYVEDGSYVVFGGFGHVRVPMIALYEIIRQRKKALDISAHPGCHDVDLLAAAGCMRRVDRAYGGGHEVRGLSPAFRRAVEAGELEVVEWSNAGLAWRFKAAAVGVPFLPSRVMLGTDTFWHSAAKVVRCPFTGMKLCLVPACFPDVSIIHVHRCDRYGNAQIDGITVEDTDIARASRRLILTTEEVVDTEEIRGRPWETAIPYYLVDAVVEAPWGAHPTNMPYLYYFDEEHISEWLRMARTPEGAGEYLVRYVYGVDSFEEYLERVGGVRKLSYLRRLEHYRAPLETPWARR